jgi:hypothetical protein
MSELDSVAKAVLQKLRPWKTCLLNRSFTGRNCSARSSGLRRMVPQLASANLTSLDVRNQVVVGLHLERIMKTRRRLALQGEMS